MLSSKRFPVVSVAVFFSVCAGCGDGEKDTSGGNGEVISPCALVSQEKAGEIMEETLGEPVTSEQPEVGLQLCLYESADALVFFQVGLTQMSFMSEETIDAGQTPTTLYNTIKDAFPDRVTVDGVGDEAFIATPGIHILAGEHYITIALGNSDDPVNQERLKEGGTEAVTNLEAILGE